MRNASSYRAARRNAGEAVRSDLPRGLHVVKRKPGNEPKPGPKPIATILPFTLAWMMYRAGMLA